VAGAVHHAHQRGILHRDLKPGNVLLDECGEAHVTDFGLAKRVAADSELTQSGAILGTPAYMAPEQASGKRGLVTTATDVYGLGAILYAVLTGRAPFGGDTPVETLEQVRERAPELPSRLNPRVPRDLEVIALKCLEKDPARRYTSAEAMADDLKRYSNGEAILARPVGLTTRAWMWCKRKPALAGMATASVLAALLTVFGGITLVLIERARRREAEVRKATETDFRLAQKTFENLLTRVGENTLIKEQDSVAIRRLRREILENALQYYQDLVNQRKDNPRLRRELASAAFRVGMISRDIRAPRDAIAALERARSIWESLHEVEPSAPEVQAQLGDCELEIGKLQVDIGDLQPGISSMGRARALLEPLEAKQPETAEYESSLAQCYWAMGKVQAELLQSLAQARELFERAEAIQRRLIARDPGNSRVQQSLAETLYSQGVIAFRRHDNSAALRHFQEVERISQSLLDRVTVGPKPVRLLDLLAISQFSIGSIEVQQGHGEAALESNARSLESLRALVTAHQSVTQYREHLGKTLAEFALQQQKLHRESQALASIHESIDVLTKLVEALPDQPEYRYDLGRSLNILGYLHDEARENRLAIPVFNRAIDEQRRAVAESPGVDVYKVELASQLDNLGEQYADLGEVALALPYYQHELDIWRKLLAAHADNSKYTRSLAETLVKVGTLVRHNGDPAAARETFRQAQAVLKSATAATASDASLGVLSGEALMGEASSCADAKEIEPAIRLLRQAIGILEPLGTSPTADALARDRLSESLWELSCLLRAGKQPAEADRLDDQRSSLWKLRPPGELADLALRQATRAALIGYGKTPITDAARAVRELDLEQAVANLRMAFDRGFRDLAKLRSDPYSSALLARAELQPVLRGLQTASPTAQPPGPKAP
jgi:tetratricopeptide (TPR) repeat protein